MVDLADQCFKHRQKWCEWMGNITEHEKATNLLQRTCIHVWVQFLSLTESEIYYGYRTGLGQIRVETVSTIFWRLSVDLKWNDCRESEDRWLNTTWPISMAMTSALLWSSSSRCFSFAAFRVPSSVINTTTFLTPVLSPAAGVVALSTAYRSPSFISPVPPLRSKPDIALTNVVMVVWSPRSNTSRESSAKAPRDACTSELLIGSPWTTSMRKCRTSCWCRAMLLDSSTTNIKSTRHAETIKINDTIVLILKFNEMTMAMVMVVVLMLMVVMVQKCCCWWDDDAGRGYDDDVVDCSLKGNGNNECNFVVSDKDRCHVSDRAVDDDDDDCSHTDAVIYYVIPNMTVFWLIMTTTMMMMIELFHVVKNRPQTVNKNLKILFRNQF